MYFQIFKDSTGYWRWRLIGSNHKVIAEAGESYYTKQDCLRAIEIVKSAMSAPVYE